MNDELELKGGAGRETIAQRFRGLANMSPERVTDLADELREAAERSAAAADLVAECRLGRALTVRRLLMVPPRNWRQSDYFAAENIVADIESALAHLTDRGVLALAVMGVERDELAGLLAKLRSEHDSGVGNAGAVPAQTTEPGRNNPGQESKHDKRKR